MSHDLYFAPAEGPADSQRVETPAQLRDYFSGRAHYEVHDAGAAYENPSTGVYFSFHFDEAAANEAETADGVSFNLNYFRPPFFALEAAIELAAFAEHTGYNAHDPQHQAAGGPFSREEFLTAWNAGNDFAYRAMLSMPEPRELFTFPRAGLEAAWEWNYTCKQRLEEMVDEVFLPRIMFIKDGSSAASVSVWPEAIPIHLPVTSSVLLGRSRGEERDFAHARWEDVEPLLSEFERVESPAPHYCVVYERLPPAIAKLFGSLPPFEMNSSMGIAYDSLHAIENVQAVNG